MTKNQERNLIVGLDIGTSKVAVIIGEVLPDGEISVVGLGNHPSRGMDKGGVNDLDSIVKSVQRALDQAELMADCQVSSVYLSISGKHIACQNENGMVSINDEEVTQEDVDNVIHTARSVKIPTERRILHVLPQEYSIDVQDGIKSPIGMSGMRMEAKAHIVTCANDMAKNITKSVERCGLTVDDLVFSGIASADSVLTNDEKDLGVCIVDIGGGTTDIAVYTNGALRHCAVISVAGNQVTSDIAKIFRTPLTHAEQIKVQFASARSSMVSREDSIEVPSVGGRPSRSMSRHTLAEVVEPRYQELFELVLKELTDSGLEDQIAAGIVLTGGTASITGAVDIAEATFGMPVRVASPLPVKGLNEYVDQPIYSTGIGLLHYGARRVIERQFERPERQGVTSLLNRVKSWFKGEF
ncbi:MULTISPECIES: cell division protein FtsA [Shewanella]|uniref:Cell division protein FtsA n=1 Tax=Shewanella japonica TaxID=93973 RepID=A0ABN4Y8G2_9GAMM|nr:MULTISPECIES: cell division protein FtsA [Shewanella]ARD20738.1 Cell division protein ftsA [Shewanella japonica]KPZ69533.1 Cell division protein FtsA [Shewanella sp. P1-14-1]MBQ4890029.1 cell division protein FtsA [Shewanella sp. MMG014]OBT05227.1 cell division protein FtsA [Shewanella sp. UCD-FRSSP16_17]